MPRTKSDTMTMDVFFKKQKEKEHFKNFVPSKDYLYYTVEQYAELMQLHPDTVRRKCRAGNIAGAKKAQSDWRIPVKKEEKSCHKVTAS